MKRRRCLFMCNYFVFDGLSHEICQWQQSGCTRVLCPSEQAWLDHLCRQGGSSLKARRKLAAAILNVRCRIPVLTSLEPLALYLPWPADEGLLWINRAEVIRAEDRFGQALITFQDGQQLQVPDFVRLRARLQAVSELLRVLQCPRYTAKT